MEAIRIIILVMYFGIWQVYGLKSIKEVVCYRKQDSVRKNKCLKYLSQCPLKGFGFESFTKCVGLFNNKAEDIQLYTKKNKSC